MKRPCRPERARSIAGSRTAAGGSPSPAGRRVRPTKDIVREAVFSALDARGAIVDARCSTSTRGAARSAIEALSRGAARAVLVERDRAALDAISAERRARSSSATGPRVVASRRRRASLAGPPPGEAPFDLVFADPPYDDRATRS